jgi:hypothetical protein
MTFSLRRSRPVVLFLAAGLIFGSAAGVVASPADAACTEAWNIVPSPNVGEAGGDFDNELSSLAVVNANDIWALGDWGTYGAARSTLALHWNGSSWAQVSTPNGVNEVNWLIGSAALASNDVWAVGYTATNPPEQSTSNTLIEHWNGASWAVIPSPNPTPPLSGGGPVSNQLLGVAAVAANDVWAVGQSTDFGAGQTLIVHWNGTTWSTVQAPHPGEYSVLRSISAVSANDIWAVGTHYVNGLQLTLVEHWNGSTWTVVNSPNDGPFLQELLRVRAVSANDVWAVGYHLSVFGASQVYQTSIFHYNGTAWTVVPSPDVNQENNYLWSVAGTSPTDAWAVGFYDTGFELKTMTQHWDGSAWTILPSPNVSTYIDELLDVAMVSPTDVWAVGHSAGFFTFMTTTMHRTTSCDTNTLHVSNISPSLVRNSARAAVTIVDSSGTAIRGAAVTVTIGKPDGSQVTATASTNRAGVASFGTQARASGTYTFTVTNVTKSTYTYDPAANVETSDSITVP